jgi:hypothetical protein
MDTLMETAFDYFASSLLLNKLMSYGVRIVRNVAVMQTFWFVFV